MCLTLWDAGHLFEENSGTLLCSDLFHQNGDVEAVTNSDIVSRFKEMLIEYQKGPFANYLPYTTKDEADSRPSCRSKAKDDRTNARFNLCW